MKSHEHFLFSWFFRIRNCFAVFVGVCLHWWIFRVCNFWWIPAPRYCIRTRTDVKFISSSGYSRPSTALPGDIGYFLHAWRLEFYHPISEEVRSCMTKLLTKPNRTSSTWQLWLSISISTKADVSCECRAVYSNCNWRIKISRITRKLSFLTCVFVCVGRSCWWLHHLRCHCKCQANCEEGVSSRCLFLRL